MKLTILASLIASAAAFAPSTSNKLMASSSLAAYKDELGVTAPLGYFDPMGVMKDKDATEFKRLRALELKHGRIASRYHATNFCFLLYECGSGSTQKVSHSLATFIPHS